jgi:hypothetical protein
MGEVILPAAVVATGERARRYKIRIGPLPARSALVSAANPNKPPNN